MSDDNESKKHERENAAGDGEGKTPSTREKALEKTQIEEAVVKGKDDVDQTSATAPASESAAEPGKVKPDHDVPATKGSFANEKEAALEADRRQEKGGQAADGTPHGKEDIKRKTKPVPSADSDDEAPFKTYKKIDKNDHELGEHRGASRAVGHGDSPVRRGEAPSRAHALYLAEYDTPAEVVHAAEKIRDAGYTHWDTHTPFPVHGMDKAMGLPDSKLGYIVFFGGLTGVTAAVAMIQWMNGYDYPIVVGGKPPDAFASMVPIMFELMVLFSSFAAVFGMFGLNKIPQHYHPIFGSDRFKKVTDDKFFLSIEVSDPKFHLEKTKDLLEKTHPSFVELVDEEAA